VDWAIILLLAANGAPILAERLLGGRGNWPIDGDAVFIDGRPLLGRSKTYRGVVTAVVVCAGIAWAAGLSVGVGLAFALYAMLGDLVSSFIKRRMGIPPSGQALGLDQFPEALLPLWLLRNELQLESSEVLMLALAFFVIELTLSRLLYRWHIRNRPY